MAPFCFPLSGAWAAFGLVDGRRAALLNVPPSADPNRSIRHLRDASATDGKAAKNLAKLRCVAACEPMSTIPCSTPSSPCSVFRLFYVMVFSYIYVTRIVVFLISSTIPFRNVWLGALFEELATLIFYFTTGCVLLEPDE